MPDSIHAHEASSLAPLKEASSATESDLLANRRTADPIVLALVDHSRRLTVEEQLYLFRVAARRVRVFFDEDQLDAIEAVEECRAKLSLTSAPSREVYRRWQEAQPVWREWPSAYIAAQAFGGNWTRLRAAVDGQPVTDMRAFAMSTNGGFAETAPLLEGLRRWCADSPDPRFRFAQFKAWAKANLALDTRQHAFRPGNEGDAQVAVHFAMSPNTYIKHFGSWTQALARAGALDDVPFETYASLMRTDRYVDDEVMYDFLRAANDAALKEIGRPATRGWLDSFRLARLRDNWLAGVFDPVPSAEMIWARFGSLPTAMASAGAWSEDEADKRVKRRGRTRSLEELALYATACARRHGVLLTQMPRCSYEHWRDDLVAEIDEPVPSYVTFLQRFERTAWGDAMREVQQVAPDVKAVEAFEAELVAKGHVMP